MSKIEIIKSLEKESERLSEIVNSADRTLCMHEKENLNLIIIKRRPAFYHRKDGKLVYVRKSDAKTIRELSSLYVDKKLKAAAVKEKKQLDCCLAVLRKDPETSDVDKVADKIPEEIKSKADLSELTAEGYARKWQEGNIVVKRRSLHRMDDYHKFKTRKGDYVGSKSELIIADRLYSLDIPYHYEIAFTPEVIIDKSRPVYDEFGSIAGYDFIGFGPDERDTLHPDFYVLNKRTRKAYFWEHLGKMDNADYCMKNFNRFMRILDAGYVIGEDLIVTHEDSKHPLLPEDIDKVIEKYLK